MKILILEPGAWGTALGILLSKKNELRFWYENPRISLKLSRLRENERLPGIKIPSRILISANLRKVIKGADLLIIASPSFNLRKTLLRLKGFENLPPLLGLAKGLERETCLLPSQIAREVLGKKVIYAHLSGPGFAREIAKGKPAREVIASESQSLLKKLKRLFQIKPLEILLTTDLIGIQIAGALKNVLSIGISLAEKGYKNPGPEKLKTALIKLGLGEMEKLGKVMVAKKETFWGPAGLGDLILTANSPLSRNFQFGQALFSNADKLRREIAERKITVEGFDTASALYKLGKIHKLDLPMINEIYKVIYKKISPKKTIENFIKLTK